jgi:hypothetical protein
MTSIRGLASADRGVIAACRRLTDIPSFRETMKNDRCRLLARDADRGKRRGPSGALIAPTRRSDRSVGARAVVLHAKRWMHDLEELYAEVVDGSRPLMSAASSFRASVATSSSGADALRDSSLLWTRSTPGWSATLSRLWPAADHAAEQWGIVLLIARAALRDGGDVRSASAVGVTPVRPVFISICTPLRHRLPGSTGRPSTWQSAWRRPCSRCCARWPGRSCSAIPRPF